jgi:hypothetical protein
MRLVIVTKFGIWILHCNYYYFSSSSFSSSSSSTVLQTFASFCIGTGTGNFDFFMLGWPCSLNYMNNNQLDVLFMFSLLSYHTSTSFGRIDSPSSGGRMYICGKWYLLYCTVDCQRAQAIPADNQLYSASCWLLFISWNFDGFTPSHVVKFK